MGLVVGRRNLFKGDRVRGLVAEQTVFEVFAREGDDALSHIGSVNATSPSLAETYARALYAEDAAWEEMAVVPRESIHRIEKPRPR